MYVNLSNYANTTEIAFDSKQHGMLLVLLVAVVTVDYLGNVLAR
jgi:hypothetical protein